LNRWALFVRRPLLKPMEDVMKIKMKIGLAGADFSLAPGEETERFGVDEAKRLIDADYAELVTEEKRETATRKPAPEKRG
jgi:hypothetical protein